MHAAATSARRHARARYFWLVRATEGLAIGHLLSILRQAGYSVQCRAAALRSLVAKAPRRLGAGTTYAVRRRLVRNHYHV